ncbi:serine/threonine-protein kinase-like protein At3g51990 [Vigna radiata var. radiata]|uniref:Serine/threonine-protein kinase-like protein At3g51990 n=1 Tax=Vigna radiata var. radiata TaxID=3916 RepID=A0A1S3UD47_VIGRR|nr:serine/threonine-protein kinase-like protein At3g51990 [Vigna radiata var. radiata]
MRYLTCNAETAIAICHPHSPKKNKKPTSPTQAHTVPHFAYSDILAATNAFSADTFLGKGSHGRVYKATLHGGALIAAVKKTKTSKEIEILSHLKSPRLVNLIGFCNDRTNCNNNKLIVVEYMPNGSLHDLLHSTKTVRPPGWTARVRFAVHVAKAIWFLHSSEPPVIHRDIKSSNVLIDDKWKARLGDFGLAFRGHMADSRVPPAGTLGYLDPCYLAPGDLSPKSDVFSFGILLLEIASGRHAIDVRHSPPSVLDWAMPLVRRGQFRDICDPRIGAPPNMAAFHRMMVLAARCVTSKVESRPTIGEVVECLTAVKKNFDASLVWMRMIRRVVKARGVDWDRSEEYMRIVKGGSRNSRRNGKVSSMLGVQYENGPANHTVRSRSVGSGFFGEMKINSVMERYPNQFGFRYRKVRLKRSMSTGLLKHYGNESNTCHERHNDTHSNDYDRVNSTEMELSKLD